jgi:quaternary ammonium compound-resistance protein SugE
MAWLVLIAAGLLEVVWAIALKRADGLTHVWPSVIGLTTAWVSFGLLALALRSLPVGTAYAVWVGIGATGVAVAGILAMGEPVTSARLAFVALIVIGVAGLKVVGG